MITKDLLSAALNISQEPNSIFWSYCDEASLKNSNYFITDVKTTANRIVSLAAKNELVRIAEQEAKAAKGPITLGFYLSMPRNNSWNGRWSGDGGKYVIIKKFTGTKGKEKAKSLLQNSYHSHSFGDGWVAGIEIKELTPEMARKDKKNSLGFCGYNWMVDSIISKGLIEYGK